MTMTRHTITGRAAGRAGELMVQSELERRGWSTANLNTDHPNAPAYDILAWKGSTQILVDVKTVRPQYPRGMEKQGGAVKKGKAPTTAGIGRNEYTVFVFMAQERTSDQFYIIPTRVVRRVQAARWTDYYASPKRNGQKKVVSGHLSLRWAPAPDGESRPGWGLATKWARYLGAWDALPKTAAC